MQNDYSDILYDINTTLENIEEQQELIIQNQQTLISGDKINETNQNNLIDEIISTNIILILALLYTFIKGCFRC